MIDASIAVVTASVITAAAAITVAWVNLRGQRASVRQQQTANYAADHRAAVEKIATYRQEWIERLRTATALFFAAQTAYNRAGSEEEQIVARDQRAFQYSYIRLCLNPDEPKHLALQTAVSNAMHGVPWVKGTPSIAELAQQIIKPEWDRICADVSKLNIEPPKD